MQPSRLVKAVFVRIYPIFATAKEVEEVGRRLCRKHSERPDYVYTTAFGNEPLGIVNGFESVSFILRHNIKPGFYRTNLEHMVRTASNLINQEPDMKTTGELRKALAQVLIDARDGKISGDALRGVIGAANQINASLSAEIKMRKQLQAEGTALDGLGQMPIGD